MNIKKRYLHLRSSLALAAALVLTSPQVIWAAGFTFDVDSHLKPGITTIEGLLVAILNIFIIIATPIIVLFIIYAGFLYVTAQGNTQQVQQATRALTYAIIGAILVLGSVALAQVIENVVTSFKAP